MITTDYLKINTFIERYQTHAFPGINYSRADFAEWIFELLRKINVAKDNVLIDVKLDVVNHKCRLPLQISKIIEVKEESTAYPMSELLPGQRYIDLSYIINNGYLETDFQDGAIILTYYGWPVDESGYPTVPNEQYYISAVDSYLQYKMAMKAAIQRKISFNEMGLFETNANYYIQATRNNSKLPNHSQYKSFQRLHKRF